MITIVTLARSYLIILAATKRITITITITTTAHAIVLSVASIITTLIALKMTTITKTTVIF